MNPATMIVLCAAAAVFCVCLVSFVQRLTGKKSCCEVQAEKPPKKKLCHRAGTLIVHIDGMHCESCRNRVTAAINALDGVCAKVSLEKRCATVSYERTLDTELLRKSIERAGYGVGEITRR